MKEAEKDVATKIQVTRITQQKKKKKKKEIEKLQRFDSKL